MYTLTYRPRDALEIKLQAMQMGEVVMTQEIADGLAQIGPAFTARSADSCIIGCFGLWMRHHGVSEAWGLVADGCTGTDMLAVTRAIGRFLGQRPEHRISTYTFSGWRAGQRWLMLMGFEFEGVMRRYTPSGRDCDLYARAGGQSWVL